MLAADMTQLSDQLANVLGGRTAIQTNNVVDVTPATTGTVVIVGAMVLAGIYLVTRRPPRRRRKRRK